MVSVDGSNNNVAKALVLDTFRPRVAILSSPTAQSLCEKNNLKFTQLIQPFTTLTTDLTWLEPYGQSITPRGLKICPVDLSAWKPSEQDIPRNRRILNNVVSQTPAALSISPDTPQNSFQRLQINARGSNYSVEIPKSTPWFEVWREVFLKLHSEQQQSQHEFLNQFMACVLVIAASEVKSSEDVTTVIGKLSKLQLQHQQEWPQTWFLPSVLKFYLVLHDNAADTLSSSEGAYQSLRTTYGGNFCYMLRINSVGVDSESEAVDDVWTPYVHKEKLTRKEIITTDAPALEDEVEIAVNPDEPFHPLSPVSEYPRDISIPNGEVKTKVGSEPCGRNLTVQDTQNIQIAINEFIGKSLLPYVERQARIMHESILNRRGVSKSFFSATKRLFGTGAKTASSVVYAAESPEMLARKLADLYFLFGHYDGAYQFYHQIKKDFQADAAWLYYASSIEMAALSHFMMTQAEPPMAVTRSFPVHYITDAITHYADLCRLPEAATRCAVILCECLKQMGNYAEAAAIFIRMTSEDCDLRSALMLEQAAYTFIKLSSPRKYALHSVLAGHRYAKAGLRTHSLNCYIQALQIYGGRGWRYAEDHVQFTIARHQAALQIYDGIVERLLSLLKTPTLQSVTQVQLFYKEFVTVASKLYEMDGVLRESIVPQAVCSRIRVLIATKELPAGEVPMQPVDPDLNISQWDSLEEQVVKECIDTSVIIFKPSRLIFDHRTDNTVNPTVPCNETFYVEVPLHNVLSTEVVLRRVALTFSVPEAVKSSVIESCTLQPGETKNLRFSASCSTKGLISFDSITYELELGALHVPVSQKLQLKGPRLHGTLVERASCFYAKDLRNKINATGEMPLLHADIENLPSVLYHSQRTEFDVILSDKSRDPQQRQRISKIVFASEHMNKSLEICSTVPPISTGEIVLEPSRKNYCPFRVAFDGSSSIRIPCVYKVPAEGDVTTLNILILYEIKHEDGVKPQFSAFGSVLYRVIKISIKIPLLPSIRVEHSLLRKCDIQTAINLLKVQNLAKENSVVLESIEFSPKIMTIEGMTWKSGLSSSNPEAVFQLLSAQSSNIVFRTKMVLPEEDEKKSDSKVDSSPLFLCINWRMQPNTQDNSSVSPTESKIKGFHRLPVSKEEILSVPDDSPIVFQLRHSTRSKHDFSQFPCYVFPVELQFSCRKSGRLILKVERESRKASESGNTDTYSASSQAVYFVGKTRWSVNVEALRTEKVTYSVALTRPGVYNIAPTISVKCLEGGTQKNYDLHSPFILDQL